MIQKHWATRLHYDFRLELDGVLISWAVPKGPSLDPKVKRMAIHVEDHPVSYGGFEGTIPEKQYGAGSVIVWDRGTWEAVGDPRDGLKAGKLVFALHGEKLAGLWELIRIAKPDDRQEAWLLFKKRDDWARPSDAYDIATALPDSVIAKPLGPAIDRKPVAEAATATETEPAVAKKGTARKTVRKAAPTDGPPMPAGARKAALPATLSPQLATLSKTPPTGDAWSVEAKFDGYRLLARIAKGKARLITRNGNDWTDKLASLATAVEALGIDEGWLDGEIVVLRDDGGQDFNALQNAIDQSKNEGITYFLFDLPFHAGHDLRAVPLAERRALLKSLLEGTAGPRIRYSDDFPSSPAEVLKAACAMRLEGVIVKRRDAPYASTRSETWLKLKCTLRQEFVIGGYTDRSNSSERDRQSLPRRPRRRREAALRGRDGDRLDPRDGARTEGQAEEDRDRPLAVRDRFDQAGPLVEARVGHRALGRADDRRRGIVRRVDAGRPSAACVVPGPADRQARAVGRAGAAERRRPDRGEGRQEGAHAGGERRCRGDRSEQGVADERQGHGLRHQGQQSRPDHRPGERCDQARPRALLRPGRRSPHPAAACAAGRCRWSAALPASGASCSSRSTWRRRSPASPCSTGRCGPSTRR